MVVVWLIALLVAGCGQALQELDGLPAIIIASDEQIASKNVLPNHYIAMFKSQAGIDRVDFANYHEETGFYAGFLADRYDYEYEVKDIRLITALTLPEPKYNTPYSLQWRKNTSSSAVGIITEVTFTSNAAARKYLHEWHAKGMLYFAEPVYVSYPHLSDTFTQVHKNYKEDASWWHNEINLINALEFIAQNNAEGGECGDAACKFNSLSQITNPPVVAVFDSGIDYDHPALKEQMLEFKKKSVDYFRDIGCVGDPDDKNSVIPEYGCNTASKKVKKGMLGDGEVYPWGTEGAGDSCPSTHRACGHGTHVAGIIAADGSGQGGVPVLGLCPFCKILNVRVMSDSGVEPCKNDKSKKCYRGSITDSSLLNGLKYVEELVARGYNIRVINASIGKFHRSRSVSLLAANLKRPTGDEKRGVIAVAAAGNESTMIRNYPAALDSVISVAATNSLGNRSSFSNYGVWIDIAAPGGGKGGGILSTVPGGSTSEDRGTSMAAPVVSGAIALVYAVVREYAGRKETRLNSQTMLQRLKHFSSEVKLYCLHPKSERYLILPESIKGKIPIQDYKQWKADKIEELCANLDKPEGEDNSLVNKVYPTEALRNRKYYVEFKGYRDKIPLIGLGMLDVEGMLRQHAASVNPLNDFAHQRKRVECVYCCASLQGGQGGMVVLLLMLGLVPIAFVLRFRA